MSAREKPPRDAERFADLLRDVRRIDQGPARAGQPASARRRTTATRPTSATAPSAPDALEPRRAPVGAPPAFRFPDPSSRHLAAAPGINDQLLSRLRRGEPEPEERIDLHGTRQTEARRLLSRRIESARARGLRCLLVVHGMGKRSATPDAVLRDAVPDWLMGGAVAHHVLALAPAPRRLGGDGATLVLLRAP